MSKVCVVSCQFPPDVGGLGASVYRITRALSDQFDIDIIATTSSKNPNCLKTVGAASVHYVSEGRNYLETINNLSIAVARLDIDRRYDLFHGFYLPVAKAIIPVARGRPIIGSVRGNDVVQWLAEQQKRAVVKEVVRRCDAITTVATDLGEFLDSVTKVRNKLRLIFNAARPKNLSWIAHDDQIGVVGSVANFRRKKGTLDLIRAFSLVPKEWRRQLLLVGGFDEDPEEGKKATLLSNELGIADQVHVTGQMNSNSAVERAMLRMRVFAMASHHDGHSNAVMEAASLGLPMVATNVGAIRELVVDEKHALVVEPRNSLALSRAIARMLADIDLAKSLGREFQRLAMEYGEDYEKEEWTKLYGEFI
ncbi:MAG: glycosyltransferase family 4 protein [Candidatus Thiodiazotropha sp.]